MSQQPKEHAEKQQQPKEHAAPMRDILCLSDSEESQASEAHASALIRVVQVLQSPALAPLPAGAHTGAPLHPPDSFLPLPLDCVGSPDQTFLPESSTSGHPSPVASLQLQDFTTERTGDWAIPEVMEIASVNQVEASTVSGVNLDQDIENAFLKIDAQGGLQDAGNMQLAPMRQW